jgi:uncharacterized membrane protein YebE (DUF533 family)
VATSGFPSAKVIMASAGYALVVAAGIAGILLATGPAEGTPMVTAWLGFCGLGGIGGAMLIGNRQIRDVATKAAAAGEVAAAVGAAVKADTQALRNGELEAKINRAIGQQLALHTAEVDRRVDKRMLTIANDVADLVVERMAS